MKIMIVTPYFYPKTGGLENYVLNIAKGLNTVYGHNVFIVTSNYSTDEVIEEIIKGIKVIRLPFKFKFYNTPFSFRWYWQLKKIIISENPDIINAHAPVPGLSDLAFLARGNIKFVITYHAGSIKKGKKFVDIFLGLYEKLFLKHMLKMSDRIISVYPDFLNSLIENERVINFIPPGVDLSTFKPSQNRKKKYDILFVGRIEKTSSWKGIDVLFRAIVILQKTNDDVCLNLVGDGDALESFKKLANELNISKHVNFSGLLRSKKLAEAYNYSRLLVLPSKTDAEAFGTVIIEAMASKVPVIASRVGGVEQIITNNYDGLTVEPDNPEELAGAIDRLLHNKVLVNRLSLNAFNKVSKSFSDQELVKRTADLFANTKKPNIIHTTAYYPPHLGGQEIIVRKLSENLSAEGYENKILTSSQGSSPGVNSENTVIVNRMRSVEFAHTAIIWSLFVKLMKETSKDTIVDLHIGHAYIPEMVWIASKIKRFKYVTHIYIDSTKTGPMSFLLPFYKKHILRKVYLDSEAVIVPTLDYKNIIEQQYNFTKGKVVVIPFGSDHAVVKEPKLLPDTKSTLKLLLVGRLVDQKNIPLAIEAIAAYVNDFGKNIRLDIVGDGPLKDVLQKKIKQSGVDDKIKIRGALFGAELENMYSAANIFILTSRQESFGMVFIEAMTKGVPIVTVNIDAVRNVVINNKNGILCAEDPHMLSRAIHKLATDKLFYERVSKSNIYNARYYRWEEIAKELSAIYEKSVNHSQIMRWK
jgi:glycosyltransferase involved in cell wall biosynthesis